MGFTGVGVGLGVGGEGFYYTTGILGWIPGHAYEPVNSAVSLF